MKQSSLAWCCLFMTTVFIFCAGLTGTGTKYAAVFLFVAVVSLALTIVFMFLAR